MSHSGIRWVDEVNGQDSWAVLNSPCGRMRLAAKGDALIRLEWVSLDVALKAPDSRVLKLIASQIEKYWLHKSRLFSISLLKHGTAYQHNVWSNLCAIDFGQTMTYSGLAQKLGSGARAIGGACRVNPYPLVVPCHRIVSVTGLGGYAGQTQGNYLTIKKTLLSHEGYLCSQIPK